MLETAKAAKAEGAEIDVILGYRDLCFLDDEFTPEYLEIAAGTKDDDYYIRMMQAWFFATALAKQWDAVIPYIREHRLSPWVHNKAIQKAVESYRISAEQKAYLRTLR